jgi:O-antigen/teichoic acid export membrane protein
MKPTRASGTFSLGLANGLSLLAAVGAAGTYARWLDATQFGHWATALAVARAGLLLLDGGLKTALVRCDDLPDAGTLRQLRRWSMALATLLVIATAAVTLWAMKVHRIGSGEATLYIVYCAAYLLTYPPLFAALARLERAHGFGAVGRAEGASVAVEFALPPLLLAVDLPYWACFAIAAVAARLLRSAWIALAARGLPEGPAAVDGSRALDLLKEGVGVQTVAALSMLRDQMHLWLLAPWFGVAWVGLYTFALTATGVVSQVFVQTASRVALPTLRATPSLRRWPVVLVTVRRLAITVLPLLAVLPALLEQADNEWWNGRWHVAVTLLPWIGLRMLAGLTTTALGAWLIVQRPPWVAAQAHARWTAIEVVGALVTLAAFGPTGLAIGGAVTAWAGVVLFLGTAGPRTMVWPRLRILTHQLVIRPSLWAALTLALWLQIQPSAWPWTPLCLVLGWWAERSVRRPVIAWFRHRWCAGHPAVADPPAAAARP